MGRQVQSSSLSKPTMGGIHSFLQQQLMAPVGDRVIYLSEDVNESSVSSVVAQIMAFNSADPKKPIVLIISTYGGSVDEMFALYDIIKFVKCPIITVGIGKVMSAGVLLLACGTKGKRMIGKNTRVMLHEISTGQMGSLSELINEIDELQKTQQMMTSALVDETKLTVEKLSEIMKLNKDFYLTAEQAIEYGIADKILSNCGVL